MVASATLRAVESSECTKTQLRRNLLGEHWISKQLAKSTIALKIVEDPLIVVHQRWRGVLCDPAPHAYFGTSTVLPTTRSSRTSVSECGGHHEVQPVFEDLGVGRTAGMAREISGVQTPQEDAAVCHCDSKIDENWSGNHLTCYLARDSRFKYIRRQFVKTKASF